MNEKPRLSDVQIRNANAANYYECARMKEKKQQNLFGKRLTDFHLVPNGSQWFPMVSNGAQRLRMVSNGCEWLRLVQLGTGQQASLLRRSRRLGCEGWTANRQHRVACFCSRSMAPTSALDTDQRKKSMPTS